MFNGTIKFSNTYTGEIQFWNTYPAVHKDDPGNTASDNRNKLKVALFWCFEFILNLFPKKKKKKRIYT